MIVREILDALGAAVGFKADLLGDELFDEGLRGAGVNPSILRGPARIDSGMPFSGSRRREMDRADIRSCAPTIWTSGSLVRLVLCLRAWRCLGGAEKIFSS